MAKIINLDALLPEETFVHIGGQDHLVRPASTQMYLEILQRKQKIRGVLSEYDNTMQTIDLICMAAPSIDRDALLSYPLVVLQQIMQIVEQGLRQGVGDVPEEGADSGE